MEEPRDRLKKTRREIAEDRDVRTRGVDEVSHTKTKSGRLGEDFVASRDICWRRVKSKCEREKEGGKTRQRAKVGNYTVDRANARGLRDDRSGCCATPVGRSVPSSAAPSRSPPRPRHPSLRRERLAVINFAH